MKILDQFCIVQLQVVLWLGWQYQKKREKKRNPEAHEYGFVKVTVPKYTDCQLQEHFRMSANVLKYISVEV